MGQPFRIGMGYDVHRLQVGRRCVLGGVEIPSDVGPEGHSDADVVLHAICDALLGALAAGDIGQHFPNHDARYAGVDSANLLHEVTLKVKQAGYQIVNVDCVVVAEKPKLSPYIEAMKERIASILQIGAQQVSVKASTQEGLGFIGAGLGIAAYAVTLLCKIMQP
ncbi:MAG: 2-C-methyl-D-erythritol 2,4-cyclodiphosphate synthase [Chitinophagales bacterium]|nr:2-C-methyl-D-erythritol 2,4-cyclodiphosphate synthase [Chitinophagales bacterium]MDW8427016.1 2-C-methyl-D-erythritol 2,4-cyclodiphosphate synthase [Chitinophagales bacterium]